MREILVFIKESQRNKIALLMEKPEKVSIYPLDIIMIWLEILMMKDS